jgi:hypothetical protein
VFKIQSYFLKTVYAKARIMQFILKQIKVISRIEGTGIPRFIALRGYCVFYKLKFCGKPALSKSVGAIFRTACAHIVSLFHILVIFAIFQTFSLLQSYTCYGNKSSVIFDVAIVIVSGCHELHLYKTVNLTDRCYMCAHCITDRPFPRLSPSPRTSLYPEINNIENRPVNNLTMVSWKEESIDSVNFIVVLF